MKTLDQHNAEGMMVYAQSTVPQKNGIACPKCGEEMLDSQPTVMLTSYPPQMNVHCQCGFVGYRIA